MLDMKTDMDQTKKDCAAEQESIGDGPYFRSRGCFPGRLKFREQASFTGFANLTHWTESYCRKNSRPLNKTPRDLVNELLCIMDQEHQIFAV